MNYMEHSRRLSALNINYWKDKRRARALSRNKARGDSQNILEVLEKYESELFIKVIFIISLIMLTVLIYYIY